MVETAHVGYADLCRDSAIQASLMALAAPSVRQSPNTFGSALAYSLLYVLSVGHGEWLFFVQIVEVFVAAVKSGDSFMQAHFVDGV